MSDYLVVKRHVEEGYEIITRQRTQGWFRQILVLVGSAGVGAFVPGFFTEVAAGGPALATTRGTHSGHIGDGCAAGWRQREV